MLSSKSVSLYWHNHSNLITQAVKQKVKEITDKLEERTDIRSSAKLIPIWIFSDTSVVYRQFEIY